MPIIDLPIPSDSLQNGLADLLAKHHRTTGAKALKVLLAKPGTVFDAIELSLAVDWGLVNSEPLIGLLYGSYSHIPVCDARALSEYRQRLGQLDNLKALRLATGHAADCSELDWEAAFLRAEIRNATKPRGGIKNIHTDKKRAYNRLRLALTRLLKRVDDPFLRSYIRRNLCTGLGFVWLGAPLSVPVEEPDLPRAA